MQYFYMMVGLPGSGKSFTAESIPNAVTHSSDAIRAEVLGDENDQTQQDLVFQTLHKRVLPGFGGWQGCGVRRNQYQLQAPYRVS